MKLARTLFLAIVVVLVAAGCEVTGSFYVEHKPDPFTVARSEIKWTQQIPKK
jgi:hypothetical protein